MPSIDTDTRLIMTILFVGAVSGMNVFFYTEYGLMFPYSGWSHAVLFGIMTVGVIMIMKALFDMVLNDRIENFLLQRKIEQYWTRMARQEDNKKRVRESLRSFDQSYAIGNIPQTPVPRGFPPVQEDAISPSFLTTFNE
jgi:hypothetical protein|tara:strand:- start:7584 stop:8000 length:417 start_codon:yes stop_codon:yes gene_type:complete